MNWRSSWTCIEMSSSLRSGRPLARRRSFWASSIWSTSSSSSSASTSGERVGFQSSTSAPETGWYFPIAAKMRNRIRMNPRKNAPSMVCHSTYDCAVPEAQITEVDVERMKEGLALYNTGSFDALREFIAPNVLVERIGNLPPLRGWEAFRAMQEPDAFEWQKIEPLDWTINGDKALIHVLIRSKGAMSGLVLEQEGWMVWTVADHLVVRIQAFTSEAEARPAAGLASSASS